MGKAHRTGSCQTHCCAQHNGWDIVITLHIRHCPQWCTIWSELHKVGLISNTEIQGCCLWPSRLVPKSTVFSPCLQHGSNVYIFCSCSVRLLRPFLLHPTIGAGDPFAPILSHCILAKLPNITGAQAVICSYTLQSLGPVMGCRPDSGRRNFVKHHLNTPPWVFL